ncbi:MAG TPA: hypothetical protein VEU06_07985 [Micropepsaceae bacterium]|jgi:hypothetical protein|nr:hypothetical protein [Micropepsaceae bacterium]
MFLDWDNFYLLVGGAAGALIGLMFVVATLTSEMNIESKRLVQGSRIYITPIVFHFGVVFVVSAMTAVPELSSVAVAVVLAFLSASGLFYSAWTTIRLFHWKDPPPDLSDKVFYGIVPVIVYLALAVTAGAVWIAPANAPYPVGAIMLVLLLIGIRNAWDLATFFSQEAPKKGE